MASHIIMALYIMQNLPNARTQSYYIYYIIRLIYLSINIFIIAISNLVCNFDVVYKKPALKL